MNLPEEVKLILDEEFDSMIWKIEIDSENQILAVETRSAENRTAAVSAFNYSTGKCYFKALSIENNWNWHLSRVYKDSVLLHGYITESSPEHKGIIAVDINTGKIKLEIFHLTLNDISVEGLIVYNPLLQSRKLMQIDFDTGEVIPGFTGEYKSVERNISMPEILNVHQKMPAFLPDNRIGPVSYAKIYETDCYSFHTGSSGIYTQCLIFVRSGKIIKEEILAGDIQKLSPEAFFISGRFVFAVKGNNRKIAVRFL